MIRLAIGNARHDRGRRPPRVGGAALVRVRAVIFDLWETLVDWDRESAAQMLAGGRRRSSATSFARAAGTCSRPRVRRRRSARRSRDAGVPDERVEDVCALRLDYHRRSLVPRAGAVETLRELRERGYLVGLITVCSEDVEVALARDRVRRASSTRRSSRRASALSKPDPRIYLRMLRGARRRAARGGLRRRRRERRARGRAPRRHGRDPHPPRGRGSAVAGLDAWDGPRVTSIPGVLDVLELTSDWMRSASRQAEAPGARARAARGDAAGAAARAHRERGAHGRLRALREARLRRRRRHRHARGARVRRRGRRPPRRGRHADPPGLRGDHARRPAARAARHPHRVRPPGVPARRRRGRAAAADGRPGRRDRRLRDRRLAARRDRGRDARRARRRSSRRSCSSPSSRLRDDDGAAGADGAALRLQRAEHDRGVHPHRAGARAQARARVRRPPAQPGSRGRASSSRSRRSCGTCAATSSSSRRASARSSR